MSAIEGLLTVFVWTIIRHTSTTCMYALGFIGVLQPTEGTRGLRLYALDLLTPPGYY